MKLYSFATPTLFASRRKETQEQKDKEGIWRPQPSVMSQEASDGDNQLPDFQDEPSQRTSGRKVVRTIEERRVKVIFQ
jgi:hypothetical protein